MKKKISLLGQMVVRFVTLSWWRISRPSLPLPGMARPPTLPPRPEHTRRRLPLYVIILTSCTAGILLTMCPPLVAVASTIKRLAGNQVMTYYYHTSSLPDRHAPIRRNSSASPAPDVTHRHVTNRQLDAVADGLQFRHRPALLTLFTTFKNDVTRDRIHRNVLYNWAALAPHVIPVLFDTDTDPALTSLARGLGWEVLPLAARSQHDVPYLKPMFQLTRGRYNSTYHGYSNGDVLYDAGLINTLSACAVTFTDITRATLLVGRRHNYLSAGGGAPLYRPGDVARAARTRGQLFRTDAEDYFLLGGGAFPWSAVPGVVVGRPGYDNYLVSLALQRGVRVVDATPTLTALHQSGNQGNMDGFINKDNGFNYREIGVFNYDGGYTTHATHVTGYNTTSGAIHVIHRDTGQVVSS